MRCRILSSLLLSLLFIMAGSATAGESLDQLYRAAIADARIAEPHEISRNLIGISAPTHRNTPPRLRWKEINGQQHVLVATWAGSYISGKDWTPGDTITLSSTTNIWVTACPELMEFFSNRGFWPDSHEARVLRVEQLLGLPVDAGKQKIIEFWVRPADVFRPSADPDPTDHEAQLEYPWKKSSFQQMDSSHRIHEYLNSSEPDRSQTYVQWFENLNATSYNAATPYPWTRLGYTYDWSDDMHSNGHIGLSEFIVLGGSNITIESCTPTAELENYFKKPPLPSAVFFPLLSRTSK